MASTKPRIDCDTIASIISTHLGPDTTWVLTLSSGEREVMICPPGMDPRTAITQLADAVHTLSCPGCDICNRAN